MPRRICHSRVVGSSRAKASNKPARVRARFEQPRGLCVTVRAASPMVLPAGSAHLASLLQSWFVAHRRALPWRTTPRDPYRTWLSEVMLQQTQVAVVIPYFERFVARFVDVTALAAGSEDEVLALWSGLGYYSRGRNLHRAARAIVADHGGIFPVACTTLRTLPGVGPYTAAAIASIAGGERVAVVDGNVARVLTRLCNDDTVIQSRDGVAHLQRASSVLVDHADAPGDHNEAMMELGALVCTPKAPSCGRCPWGDVCAARRHGSILTLPKKQAKRARTAMHIATIVPHTDDAVWLTRRDADGLFGGMHEPPALVVTSNDPRAAWRTLLEQCRLPVPRAFPDPVIVERALTHRDLTFMVLPVRARGDEPELVARAQLSSIGISSAVRAVLQLVFGPQRELFS